MIKISSKTLATPAVMVGGDFFRGTYTGDGNATQAIVGVGFQPIVVIIYKRAPAGATIHTIIKTDQDATQSKVLANIAVHYENDHIISLDVDGFTVGDGTGGVANVCNILAQDYTYICFG